MPANTVDQIAFYGSLMRRAENRLAEAGVRPGDLEPLGDCLVPGELYHLGSYPGLVAGDGAVPGELYKIVNPVAIPLLDDFEGVSEDLYHRKAVELVSPEVVAWIYYYSRSVAGLRRLEAWPPG